MFIKGFEKISSVAHEVGSILQGAGKAGNKAMAKDLTKKFVAGPKAPLSTLGKTSVLGKSKLPKPASTQSRLSGMPDKMKARASEKLKANAPAPAKATAPKAEIKPAAKKGFMDGLPKSHIAAGAGGLAVGYGLASGNKNQGQ
jgi:hypothetical protein